MTAGRGIEGWPNARELFVPFGAGLWAQTDVGSALRARIHATIRSVVGPEITTRLALPPVVPARITERADYLAAFPHLLGAVRAFSGTRHEHLALLDAAHAGTDWSEMLDPTGLVLPAAACHAIYDLVADSTIETTATEVIARCFRHEPSDEATRMQSFEMLEFVCIGTDGDVAEFVERANARTASVLADLGLEAVEEPATDPFFGVAAALLESEQRSSEAKTEFVVDGPEGPFAIASINRHGDHFGEAFAIVCGSGRAHSACVAFGIDRLMLAVAASSSERCTDILEQARTQEVA